MLEVGPSLWGFSSGEDLKQADPIDVPGSRLYNTQTSLPLPDLCVWYVSTSPSTWEVLSKQGI